MSNRTIFFYTHTSIENQLVITFQAIGDIQNYVINLCYKGQMGKCSNTFKVNLSENSTYSERLVKFLRIMELCYFIKKLFCIFLDSQIWSLTEYPVRHWKKGNINCTLIANAFQIVPHHHLVSIAAIKAEFLTLILTINLTWLM